MIVLVSILMVVIDSRVFTIAQQYDKKMSKKKVFRSRLRFHHCLNLRVLHR